MKFKLGDRVKKIIGYNYFGVIVASFTNLSNEPRYVVESTSIGSRGMLFIFNDKQLDFDK